MFVELKAEAEQDLARIYAFNEERSQPWADKVDIGPLAGAERLLRTPNIGRAFTDTGVRRLSLPDIQYVIDYEVLADRISVLRFLSTREIR